MSIASMNAAGVQKTPVVSIGLPVYNAETTIAEALDSILLQTFKDFEVVICDNASTDKTQEIIEKYVKQDNRVRYYRAKRNRGASANFNWTFELSRGEFFKWHGADDIILPGFLEACIEPLQIFSDIVLCFPSRIFITFEGQGVKGEPQLVKYRQIPQNQLENLSLTDVLRLSPSRMPLLIHGLIRRSVLSKTGLIGAFHAADVCLIFELRLHGRFVQIPKDYYIQRLHKATKAMQFRLTRKGESSWYGSTSNFASISPEIKLFIEMLRSYQRASASRDKNSNIDKASFKTFRELLSLRAHIEIRLVYFILRKFRRNFFRFWSKISESFLSPEHPNIFALRIWRGCSSFFKGRLLHAFNLFRSQSTNDLFMESLGRMLSRGTVDSLNIFTLWLESGDSSKTHIAAQVFLRGSHSHKIRFLNHIRNEPVTKSKLNAIKFLRDTL